MAVLQTYDVRLMLMPNGVYHAAINHSLTGDLLCRACHAQHDAAASALRLLVQHTGRQWVQSRHGHPRSCIEQQVSASLPAPAATGCSEPQAAHLHFDPADDALLDIEGQLEVVERVHLQPDVVQHKASLPCCNRGRGLLVSSCECVACGTATCAASSRTAAAAGGAACACMGGKAGGHRSRG